MVFHNRPFKKDLTKLAKGGSVVKHIGKGAREQSARGGSTLTGGDPFARMANRYPKPTPADLGDQESLTPTSSQGPATPPVPMGTRPPNAPTALMPSAGGEPDEDDAA